MLFLVKAPEPEEKVLSSGGDLQELAFGTAVDGRTEVCGIDCKTIGCSQVVIVVVIAGVCVS
jgi:hypothetical protein